MDNFPKIFPQRLSWSEAVSDISIVDKDIETLRLVSKVRGVDKLPELTKLKKLWCFDVNPKFFELICKCTSLEELFIDGLKSSEIQKLKELRFLKILSIDSCSKIKTLSEFEELKNLKGLSIVSCKNVHNLESLKVLNDLETLAIAGGMTSSSRMTVESFLPLSKLQKLKFLHLTNIKALDGSLEPLSGLIRLSRLDLANFYTIEQFARLSGKLKNTECTWFKPYIEMGYTKCGKCEEQTMVMLTGKGVSTLCKYCDAERLAKHVEKFQNVKKELNR